MPLAGLAIEDYSLSPSATLQLLAPCSFSWLLPPCSLFNAPASWLQDISSCPKPHCDPSVDLAVLGDTMCMEGGQAALVGNSIEESLEIEITTVFVISVFCLLSMVFHKY